jgi:alpha-D-xyloside xylohydrolase
MAAVLCLLFCWGASLFSSGTAQTVSSFTQQSDGALCVLSNSGNLKLQVCAPNIIRVVYTMQSTIPAPQGFVVSKTAFSPGTFTATENTTSVVVSTPQITATVSKANALVTFTTASGTAITNETARTLVPVTKGGQAGDSGTLNFNSPSSEGVYGLGNLSESSGGWAGTSYWDNQAAPPDRNGQLNIRSFTFDMHQVNWMDIIPFFMTTSGYGILMNFCCHATKTSPLNFTASYLLNNSWDYFFIYGPQFDTIIAGYRDITGPAPMLPKWAYGYWQCKNRYMSSSQITGVIDTFRTKNIPLDCIVQDWSWWSGTTSGYGSFTWDNPYANPSSWISTIHGKNCHFAISIWENFMPGEVNYASMQPHLLTETCNANGGPYLNIFDSTGASMYWDLVNTALYQNGVDAWWNDATEPECPLLTGQITPGSGVGSGVIDRFANAYSIACAKNIYEKQRGVSSLSKRVVNLTRSFYGGQQRYGTIYWNGDLNSDDIGNVATTISGGINSSMAGNPYWCSDIGGFMSATGSASSPSDEVLSRWFEAGAFFPVFRIHGSRNTEIYNMSAAVQPVAMAFTKLRYRLMPYIYSLAWKVTSEAYTMTRALWFDFPGDNTVINIANQYMFGPALMINPVTTSATSRNVYLPAGTWYDFWTGTPNTGSAGRSVSASAPLSIIPIYARAGAILPMGPRIQYTGQKQADTIELRVYPGADGSFTLYEDEGDNYNYEKGTYATIPITYSNAGGGVTIGARSGTFSGMLQNRVFKIVKVSTGHGIADTMTSNPDCVVNYTGASVIACGTNGIIKREPEKARKEFLYSFKTSEEKIVFPLAYANAAKEISVFAISGRLLQKSVFKKQAISMRKDFGLSGGVYIIKVRMAQ